MRRFADIVDDVTALSIEEMVEIENILQKNISEKKREQILINKTETEQLYKEGKLKFYDNASDVLNALNEE